MIEGPYITKRIVGIIILDTVVMAAISRIYSKGAAGTDLLLAVVHFQIVQYDRDGTLKQENVSQQTLFDSNSIEYYCHRLQQ